MDYTKSSRWRKEQDKKELRNKIIGWGIVAILILAIEVLFISVI